MDFFTMPMLWKKLEVTIWKPTMGYKANTMRSPLTARSVRVPSVVKSDTAYRGNSSPTMKPHDVMTTPQKAVFLKVAMTLSIFLAP